MSITRMHCRICFPVAVLVLPLIFGCSKTVRFDLPDTVTIPRSPYSELLATIAKVEVVGSGTINKGCYELEVGGRTSSVSAREDTSVQWMIDVENATAEMDDKTVRLAPKISALELTFLPPLRVSIGNAVFEVSRIRSADDTGSVDARVRMDWARSLSTVISHRFCAATKKGDANARTLERFIHSVHIMHASLMPRPDAQLQHDASTFVFGQGSKAVLTGFDLVPNRSVKGEFDIDFSLKSPTTLDLSGMVLAPDSARLEVAGTFAMDHKEFTLEFTGNDNRLATKQSLLSYRERSSVPIESKVKSGDLSFPVYRLHRDLVAGREESNMQMRVSLIADETILKGNDGAITAAAMNLPSVEVVTSLNRPGTSTLAVDIPQGVDLTNVSCDLPCHDDRLLLKFAAANTEKLSLRKWTDISLTFLPVHLRPSEISLRSGSRSFRVGFGEGSRFQIGENESFWVLVNPSDGGRMHSVSSIRLTGSFPFLDTDFAGSPLQLGTSALDLRLALGDGTVISGTSSTVVPGDRVAAGVRGGLGGPGSYNFEGVSFGGINASATDISLNAKIDVDTAANRRNVVVNVTTGTVKIAFQGSALRNTGVAGHFEFAPLSATFDLNQGEATADLRLSLHSGQRFCIHDWTHRIGFPINNTIHKPLMMNPFDLQFRVQAALTTENGQLVISPKSWGCEGGSIRLDFEGFGPNFHGDLDPCAPSVTMKGKIDFGIGSVGLQKTVASPVKGALDRHIGQTRFRIGM